MVFRSSLSGRFFLCVSFSINSEVDILFHTFTEEASVIAFIVSVPLLPLVIATQISNFFSLKPFFKLCHTQVYWSTLLNLFSS